MPQWTLRDEMDLAEINVPRAALLLARGIAYPDLDIAFHLDTLNEITDEASDAVPGALPVEEQGQLLAAFLFEELAFRGDVSTYADVRNSFLNDVLARRMGIPITLSVLYVEIAQRLGLPAYGISMPGHFIAGLRSGDDTILLDPFHGGRRLNLNDCAELIQMSIGYRGPLDAAWFQPAAAVDILVRILNNLRAAYVNQQDWAQAASVVQHLRIVQPDEPAHLRDLGLVYYRQNALPQAAHYLEAYLQQAPNAEDARVIREGVGSTLDSWALMN